MRQTYKRRARNKRKSHPALKAFGLSAVNRKRPELKNVRLAPQALNRNFKYNEFLLVDDRKGSSKTIKQSSKSLYGLWYLNALARMVHVRTESHSVKYFWVLTHSQPRYEI